MARTSVNKRSAVSYGTLVTDFNANTTLTAAGTRTTPSSDDVGPPNTGDFVNTDYFLSGSSSVKVVVDRPAGDSLCQIRVDEAMDLSNAKSVYVWVYRASETAAVSPDNSDTRLTLRCFTGSFGTVTDFYSWTDIAGDRAARNATPAGWVCYVFDIEDAAESDPAPSGLADIQWFWLEVAPANATVYSECYLDSVYIDMRQRPKVLFSIDDGFASDKTEAYDYMVPKGMYGTSNVYKSRMLVGNDLTPATATTMYNGGWDICNHSSTADIPATIDQLNENRDYLNSLGFTRSSGFIAYPGNDFDVALMKQVAAAGHKMCRGRIAASNGDACYAPTLIGHPDKQDQWPYDQHAVPFAIAFDSDAYDADSGVFIKAQIDAAIKYGRTCIIMVHEIVASGATGNQTNRAAFRDIVGYVERKMLNGECDVVTMSQLYDQMTGPGRSQQDRISA